jgi:hypothetical protein
MLGNERQCNAQQLMVTPATETELTRKVGGLGHKLYMDNFFSSPELFNVLAKTKVNCCGGVRINRKVMPENLRCKTVKL